MTPFKMHTETRMEKYRNDSFWDKEPELIAWVDSFLPHNVFIDIGANVGCYSLYNSHRNGESLTYAFEPYYGNASRLMQNIELNKFDNIIVVPFGVGAADRIDTFGLVSREKGHSGSEVNKYTDDYYMLPIVRLDSFCEMLEIYPDHIKIDIDGQELQVIEGALQTIYNDPCKSVLVEINKDGDKIREIFKGFGYTEDNRFNKMKNHSRVRREKEGIKCENVIFSR